MVWRFHLEEQDHSQPQSATPTYSLDNCSSTQMKSAVREKIVLHACMIMNIGNENESENTSPTCIVPLDTSSSPAHTLCSGMLTFQQWSFILVTYNYIHLIIRSNIYC